MCLFCLVCDVCVHGIVNEQHRILIGREMEPYLIELHTQSAVAYLFLHSSHEEREVCVGHYTHHIRTHACITLPAKVCNTVRNCE